MKYPKLKQQTERRLYVPSFTGGIDRQSEPSHIRDDTLSDSTNVWWDNGALRTRTGLSLCQSAPRGANVTRTFTGLRGNGGSYVLDCAYTASKKEAAYTVTRVSADGRDYTDRGTTVLVGTGAEVPSFLPVRAPFAETDGTELYGFGLNGGAVTVRRLPAAASAWTEATPYVPTVMVNGGARGKGEPYEAYNLLTGAFRAQYTTDGETWRFYLPRKPLTKNAGEVIRIVYVSDTGTEYAFSVAPSSAGTAWSSGVAVDGVTVYARVEYARGRVSFWTNTQTLDTTTVWIPPDTGEANNLTVTAWKTAAANGRKIGGMTVGTWFSSGSAGVRGGNRLFLSGNPQYTGLVCWSDADDPLYFPEDNYTYVGDAGERVTAFCAADGYLAVFKEHSVYALTPVAVSGGSKATVGVTVPFAVRQLHGSIGCDLPHTVAVFGDRPIWATSAGGVYVLTAPTAYSDGSVKACGAACGWDLTAQLSYSRPVAATVWRGRYLLLIGNTVYAAQQTERGIAWYVWDVTLPHLAWEHLTSDGVAVCLFGCVTDGGDTRSYYYTLDGERDDTLAYDAPSDSFSVVRRPVRATFATKQFDFGYPERDKRLSAVWIEMDGTDGSTVTVSYTTEDGVLYDGASVTFGATEELPVSHTLRMTPNIGRVSRVGLRLTCDGTFRVNGMCITYKQQGGVR